MTRFIKVAANDGEGNDFDCLLNVERIDMLLYDGEKQMTLVATPSASIYVEDEPSAFLKRLGLYVDEENKH
jgi:hypothetical protein